MRTNTDNDNYAPPAKIKGFSGCYRQPLLVAFAFLLTPDCPCAVLSALLCLVQRSSLTISRSLTWSVPGQPCVWPGIQRCWGQAAA